MLALDALLGAVSGGGAAFRNPPVAVRQLAMEIVPNELCRAPRCLLMHPVIHVWVQTACQHSLSAVTQDRDSGRLIS